MWPIGKLFDIIYRLNTNSSFNSSEETDHEAQVVPVYSIFISFFIYQPPANAAGLCWA